MPRWPSRLLRRSGVVFLSNVILRDDSAAYLIGLDSLSLLIILHLSHFVFQSFLILPTSHIHLLALYYTSILYIRAKNAMGNSNRDNS